MLPILSALVVAASIVWAAIQISGALTRARASKVPVTDLIGLFAPGIAAVAENPKALLTWQPLALAARKIYAAEFAELDQAYGATFPFSTEQLQAAHSRWTTDWLTWERNHDAEYKLKAALLAHEMGEAASSAAGRARLNAIESEKIERYQRRYEEYSLVSRALQALLPR